MSRQLSAKALSNAGARRAQKGTQLNDAGDGISNKRRMKRHPILKAILLAEDQPDQVTRSIPGERTGHHCRFCSLSGLSALAGKRQRSARAPNQPKRKQTVLQTQVINEKGWESSSNSRWCLQRRSQTCPTQGRNRMENMETPGIGRGTGWFGFVYLFNQ